MYKTHSYAFEQIPKKLNNHLSYFFNLWATFLNRSITRYLTYHVIFNRYVPNRFTSAHHGILRNGLIWAWWLKSFCDEIYLWYYLFHSFPIWSTVSASSSFFSQEQQLGAELHLLAGMMISNQENQQSKHHKHQFLSSLSIYLKNCGWK